MKIELIKEEKFGDQDWYCVLVDGTAVAFEHTEEKANELYQMLIDIYSNNHDEAYPANMAQHKIE